MELEIRQLRRSTEFQECIRLQREIWGLEPENSMSPLTINNLAMPNPEVGVVLGGYVRGEMVGLQVLIPTTKPGLIFGHLFGLSAPYRDSGLGYKFHLGMIAYLKSKGFKQVSWTFDPLEGRNAHSYLNKLGGTVSHYIVNHYAEYCERFKGMPQDRFLFNLNLNQKPPAKVPGKQLKLALVQYPIATKAYMPNSDTVLVKIPGNLQKLRKEHPPLALEYRMETRELFMEYINRRGMMVDRLYTGRINQERCNYYRLRKKRQDRLQSLSDLDAA
jgi:chorismate synthase